MLSAWDDADGGWGGTVGQWDSSKYGIPKVKKKFYIYISIYNIYRYIDIEV